MSKIIRELKDMDPEFIKRPDVHTYANAGGEMLRHATRLGVAIDSQRAENAATTFYLWLKAVDDYIDNERGNGERILDGLTQPMQPERSAVCLLTERLRNMTGNPEFVQKMTRLHESVCREGSARNMEELIKAREDVGYNTAQAALQVVLPYATGQIQAFGDAWTNVSVLGMLTDSAVDLRKDVKDGVVLFKPTLEEVKLLGTKIADYKTKT